MPSSSLSTPSQVLPNAAALFSLMLSGTGISQLVRPESALELWRFPPAVPCSTSSSTASAAGTPPGVTATAKNQKGGLVHGLIRREAMRNVALGLVGLATWYRGDRRLLGCVLLCGCFTAFSDGLISRAVVGGEELRHWAFLPFMLSTAAGLLGWLG
ncbi:uncharacterized protein PG998_009318 [Apiospora kogelbergensis]|uniref:uncharacterized protein n=1 Tax=Apiospora kogelbergensis TaxID=1337665 RepID=UPI0031329383